MTADSDIQAKDDMSKKNGTEHLASMFKQIYLYLNMH